MAIIVSGFIIYPKMGPEDTNPGTTTTPMPSPNPTPAPSFGIVTDLEGNVYRTIKIGSQIWMAENLKTTKFNDGQDITLVTSGYEWGRLSTPGYCYFNNEPTNKDDYGILYNWYAVKTGKLAPQGWRVPTEEDWDTLTAYLGGVSVAGGKLKERGTARWNSPNLGATDEFGFTAFPCSTRGIEHGDHFYGLRNSCYFWSVGELNSSEAWFRYIIYDSAALKIEHAEKTYGRPVRCLMDTNSAPTSGI